MTSEKQNLKPIIWAGSSKRDLLLMPEKVVTNFGYAIFQAQSGAHPDIAKPLKRVWWSRCTGADRKSQERYFSGSIYSAFFGCNCCTTLFSEEEH